MKPHLAQDIIPVSEFRRKTASYLQEIRSRGRTVVLTQDGRSAAVVMSPETFEQMEYERELLAAIARGEKEIKEGRGIPHKDVFRRLSRRLETV
jgi:prevent-host-death family protein